jgi:hypothetical protein
MKNSLKFASQGICLAILIFACQPQCWDYAATWLLRNEKYDDGHGGRYGVNQELFYTVNSRWKLGFGAEWIRNYNWDYGYDEDNNYDVYSFRL